MYQTSDRFLRQKFTKFRFCEKSTLQNDLLSLVFQGIKQVLQVSNDLFMSLEPGRTDSFVSSIYLLTEIKLEN